MNIGVVGVGYVGLVTAAGLARRGHRVACVDVDLRRVDAVNAGTSFLHEPGLEPLLKQVVSEGTLRATTETADGLRGADVVFLCVGTPSAADGGIDLRAVRESAAMVGRTLRDSERYTVVAVKSTVVPGTTEGVVAPLVWEAAGRDRRTIGLAANPEFLREGQAVEDFLQPDRVVIGGIDERSTRTVAGVYAGFSAPVRTVTPRAAETIKYASNALLALLISFSNEIGGLCEAMPDVDVEVVMDALHLDRRLSPMIDGGRLTPEIVRYLKAGCGFGGSCLPKDLRALVRFARGIGANPRLLDAALKVNDTRPDVLVRLAVEELGGVANVPVAVLGLAFKPGTDDLRESPAIPVVDRLVALGARVRAYDPAAGEGARRLWAANPRVQVCDSSAEACVGTRAVILVTAWPDFADLDWDEVRGLMAGTLVIDGRRVLDPVRISQAGFRYRGVGAAGGGIERSMGAAAGE